MTADPAIVSFTDSDGHIVRVQWSSAADASHARVYIRREKNSDASPVDACLHLTAPQVAMLIAGLQEWENQNSDE